MPDLDLALVAMAMSAGWTKPVIGARRVMAELGLIGQAITDRRVTEVVDWLRENAE